MKSKNIFINIGSFFEEVKTEMKKVSWPTKKETIKNTTAVLGISFVVAVFLGGLDFVFTKILNIFIR